MGLITYKAKGKKLNNYDISHCFMFLKIQKNQHYDSRIF
jgi:hypothetical protein